MERIVIYASGIGAMSVCAEVDAAVDEIEKHVNMESPTGISSRWSKTDEPFADGKPNPCYCDQDECRQHWLLTC